MKLLKKIRIASGIVSVSLAIAVLIVSSLIYSYFKPFSVFTHWISNLGIGPMPSRVIFQVGLLISAILLAPFLFEVRLTFREKDRRLINLLVGFGFFFSMVMLAGIVMIAWSPADILPLTHAIGAVFFFGGSLQMMFYYSLASLMGSKIPKKIARLGAMLPVMYAMILIIDVIVITLSAEFNPNLTIYMSNIISSLSGAGPSVIKLNEWIMFVMMLGYFIFLSSLQIRMDE
ncbi:MAG: hypothetical protein ACTSQ8_17465 [Candidatus Helarchaeota archaeon]